METGEEHHSNNPHPRVQASKPPCDIAVASKKLRMTFTTSSMMEMCYNAGVLNLSASVTSENTPDPALFKRLKHGYTLNYLPIWTISLQNIQSTPKVARWKVAHFSNWTDISNAHQMGFDTRYPLPLPRASIWWRFTTGHMDGEPLKCQQVWSETIRPRQLDAPSPFPHAELVVNFLVRSDEGQIRCSMLHCDTLPPLSPR